MLNEIIQALSVFSCITVPETVVMVMFTYIILGRHDLLDKYNLNHTIKQMSISVIPSALLLNLFIYVLKISAGFSKLMDFVLLYFLLLYVVNKNNYQNVIRYKIKILISLVCGYLFIAIIEAVYLYFLLNVTHQTFSMIANNLNIFLLASVPLRVVEFTAITLILLYKNKKKSTNILKIVLKNKTLLFLTVPTSVMILIEILYIVHLMLWRDILLNMALFDQLIFIIMFLFLIPSLLISWMYYFIIYFIKQENSLQQLYQISDTN